MIACRPPASLTFRQWSALIYQPRSGRAYFLGLRRRYAWPLYPVSQCAVSRLRPIKWTHGRYRGKDPALDHLATIVRGADTSRHDLSPQCGGLFAISLGLSANFPDDHEMLKHGMVMYDALYTWCRSLQAETHNWPARAVGA